MSRTPKLVTALTLPLVLSLSLATGCEGGGEGGSGASAPDVDCTAPADHDTFELGTGELCFEPLSEGDALPLMAGPQGGYHVFLSIGCADCGDAVTLTYSLLDPATMAPLERTYPGNQAYAELFEVDDWRQSLGIQIGMPGFQWGDEDPPLAEGTEFVVSVEVTRENESSPIHEAELKLVLGPTQNWDPCDANPDGECCDRSCDGF